jgi:acyl dehydratase
MTEARYFEDIPIGDDAEFGSYEVTQAEIVEFAERYDPQWFHTDPEAAADSSFGSVIAPGWHTAAISQRLLAEHYMPTIENVAARGADEVRWHAPVTPGDVLSCRVEVVDKTAYSDERGQVDLSIELHDRDGECVFSFVALLVVERKR